MTDYTRFQRAGIQFPLASQGALRPVLRDTDPSLYFTLDFAEWIIETHVGPRLLREAHSCGQKWPKAVLQRYPIEPVSEVLSTDFQFPGLFVWRTNTAYVKKTAGWYEDACDFVLMYVMPALHPAQAVQLQPMLRSVEAALSERIMRGYDGAYAPPGGSAGLSPWGRDFANVDRMTLNRGGHGYLQGMGNLYLPCLRIEGSFLERSEPVPADHTFAGGDVTVSIDGKDVVSMATDVGPLTPPSE